MKTRLKLQFVRDEVRDSDLPPDAEMDFGLRPRLSAEGEEVRTFVVLNGDIKKLQSHNKPPHN